MQNQSKAFRVLFNTSVPVIIDILLFVHPEYLLKSPRGQETQPRAPGRKGGRVVTAPSTAPRSAQPLPGTFSRALGKAFCRCSAAAASRLPGKVSNPPLAL